MDAYVGEVRAHPALHIRTGLGVQGEPPPDETTSCTGERCSSSACSARPALERWIIGPSAPLPTVRWSTPIPAVPTTSARPAAAAGRGGACPPRRRGRPQSRTGGRLAVPIVRVLAVAPVLVLAGKRVVVLPLGILLVIMCVHRHLPYRTAAGRRREDPRWPASVPALHHHGRFPAPSSPHPAPRASGAASSGIRRVRMVPGRRQEPIGSNWTRRHPQLSG
ncbi:hypothetical protein NKH18_26820 [Streptomyces sp. M10(2022)]